MDPSNFLPGYDVGERGSAGLMEPDPSSSDFTATLAADLAAAVGSCDASLLLYNDHVEAQQPVNAFKWPSLGEFCFFDSDQHRGAEYTVTETSEHCINNQADSGVSGIHCHNTRSGGTLAVNSSQQVSSHPFNDRKDELGCFGKQEHSSINHKFSQGTSCSKLPWATSEEDEIQSSNAIVDGNEPRVGMPFSSEKTIYDFYSNYAKKAGFNVRRGKAEYLGSDKSVIKAKSFLCSCQGRKSKEQIDKPTLYKRQDTRTGCDAMIKCNVNDGTWQISKVVLKHNHDLKGHVVCIHKRAEGSHTKTSLSTGKIVDEVTTARKQDFVFNVNNIDVSQGTSKSHPMPGSNDTQDLTDYFNNMLLKDPFFFYTLELGKRNFFWRDSRSMLDYMHFGDVLVLDTRSRINKFDMTCAVFWGLNHQLQHIIFGCAVLVDQTICSFSWLLESFLTAMNGKKPRTVITDVSEEIANALTNVLPETCHCLPAWSILSSFSKHLSSLIDQVDRSGTADLFGECIFHVHSQEEFESKWNSLIGKTKLHEDPWLASLYGMREKWSHAFTKNVLSNGLLSIKNNENARAVLGNHFCETMTQYQIALRCGEAAEQMRMEESKEDRHCKKEIETLISRSPMEKEAERLYTRPIFRMFQGELINSLSLAIEESGATPTGCKFKLTEGGSTKEETVEFDPSNLTLQCSCGKFESVGILCFHALKVLNSKNIFKIPPRYLSKRWMKSAKDSPPVDTPNAGIARDGNPVNSFYVEFMQKALHVAHICATKKRKRIAWKSICLILETIAKAPRTEEMADAVEDSVGNDAMDQPIFYDALETQLDQENVDRINSTIKKQDRPNPVQKDANIRAQMTTASMSDRSSERADWRERCNQRINI